jgi:hypothetical protein
MPTLTTTRNYADATVLTEAQLDAAFDSLETFLNSTKIDSTNIQSGGVAEANLATGAVTEAKLGAAAVTTTKVADSAVTTAKIADLNVTTAKINDSAVTAAKIAAGVITQVKMGSVGQQLSSSCGTFNTSSSSLTDVTNLSVSITTTGRPVYLALVSDGSGNGCYLGSQEASNAINVGEIAFLRGATEVARAACSYAPSFGRVMQGPPFHIDAAAAGTYTYKVQARVVTGTAMNLGYLKLLAFEL